MVAVNYFTTFVVLAASVVSTLAAPTPQYEELVVRGDNDLYEELAARGLDVVRARDLGNDQLQARSPIFGLGKSKTTSSSSSSKKTSSSSKKTSSSGSKTPVDPTLQTTRERQKAAKAADPNEPVKKLSFQECNGCRDTKRTFSLVEKFWKSGGFQKAGYNNVRIIMGDGGIAQCFFSNTRNGARAGGATRVD